MNKSVFDSKNAPGSTSRMSAARGGIPVNPFAMGSIILINLIIGVRVFSRPPRGDHRSEREDIMFTKKSIPILLTILLLSFLPLEAQSGRISPAVIGQALPDASLPVLQGGEMTLSGLKGKNVLLVFPRGLAGKDHWCHVCNYQYAELVELDRKEKIREALDLEIVFVLPYSREMVEEWVASFPSQLKEIAAWKNPSDPDTLDEQGRARMQRIRRWFPKDFMYEDNRVPTPFPILIDSDRSLTGPLGIFTTEWSGSEIDQNIPTILLLDKQGLVQFKYMSQNTFDRPSPEYLFRFIRRMLVP